ncbi:MAG TPA: hypothetical protein PKX17_05410, partial [Candidatus Methanomethylicus sp.]|nr:hypothetical protein [Candidatus Methanomethylicus sp.]
LGVGLTTPGLLEADTVALGCRLARTVLSTLLQSLKFCVSSLASLYWETACEVHQLPETIMPMPRRPITMASPIYTAFKFENGDEEGYSTVPTAELAGPPPFLSIFLIDFPLLWFPPSQQGQKNDSGIDMVGRGANYRVKALMKGQDRFLLVLYIYANQIM